MTKITDCASCYAACMSCLPDASSVLWKHLNKHIRMWTLPSCTAVWLSDLAHTAHCTVDKVVSAGVLDCLGTQVQYAPNSCCLTDRSTAPLTLDNNCSLLCITHTSFTIKLYAHRSMHHLHTSGVCTSLIAYSLVPRRPNPSFNTTYKGNVFSNLLNLLFSCKYESSTPPSFIFSNNCMTRTAVLTMQHYGHTC